MQFARNPARTNPSGERRNGLRCALSSRVTSRSSHLFRLDLLEVSTVGLDEARKALVIEVWTPGAGVREMRRD